MIFLLFIMNLWARDVVIPSEQTPDIKYRKYLEENLQSRSFIQYYISQKTNQTYELLNELKLGQFHLLSGNLKKAGEHFKKVAEFQHQANWNLKERDGIHYALMRLSQMEENKDQKHSWLKQAVVFDYVKKPDPKLFPPPLIESYEKLKKKIVQHIWPLPKQADLFDRVLINGKEQKGHTGFIKTVGAIQRIQLLSNRYLPVHYVTHPDKLEKLIMRPISLAQGSCHQPVLNTHINSKWQWVYLEGNCTSDKRSSGQPYLAKKSPHQSQTTYYRSMTASPKDVEEKRKTKFYKSKWFWLGLSVLTTGFVFQNFEKNKRSQPQARQIPVFHNYETSK